MESTLYKNNYFITLTYDDDHVPYKYVGDENGEAIKINELIRRDLTLFLKKLRIDYQRKNNHIGIRYYASGEYGDRTYRPHFHILLFNCPIDDLKFYKKNFDDTLYFNSDRIQKI